ncbi:MAG: dapA [Chthonomonadaceae bacterium]|nr:dapA [Chthonomonadaceae bacterium]
MAAEVHVALLTPASADGQVDEGALGAHLEWLASTGVDGLLVAGTTGEGPLLEDREVECAVARATEAAAGRMQVVVQVGRPATHATVALARVAATAGATAVAVVVPYYFAYDDDQLLRHFAAVTAAVAPLPVVAYSIPARTQNDVSPALLRRLAGEGVAGIKDSTKSLERHLEYLDVAREHALRVYMGSDGLALEALRVGATGLMSAIANVMPEKMLALRDAVADANWPLAEAIQDELTAFRVQAARQRPLVWLKADLSRRLHEMGAYYSADLRLPLG